MFLLDTNILSERIRAKPNLPVVRKLLSYEPALLFASEMDTLRTASRRNQTRQLRGVVVAYRGSGLAPGSLALDR